MLRQQKRQNITIVIILIAAVIALIVGCKIVEKRKSAMIPMIVDVDAKTTEAETEAETTTETATEIAKTNSKKWAFLDEYQMPLPRPTATTTTTTTTAKAKEGSYEWYCSLSKVEQLARIIFAEAGGESVLTQKMAGTVVMNRVAHPAFKQATIADVVYASGQYEPTWSGTIKRTPSETSYGVARWLLAGNRAFGPDVVWQGPQQGYNCVFWGNMWFGTYSKDSHDLDEYKKTTKPTESVETTEPTKTTELEETTEIIETTEPVESVETTEITEPTKSAEPVETTETTEPEATTEPAEPTETTEPAETAKITDPTKTTEPEETTSEG